MSWISKKELESPYRGMALGFLINRHDVQFEGHCQTCDAYQPVYLNRLLEAHGKTAIFRDIEPEISCLFCNKSGVVSVRFVER
jgi:hypothetical protein